MIVRIDCRGEAVAQMYCNPARTESNGTEKRGINPNEIANAVYVRFGRCPDRKTVRRVLEEEPIPLRFVRRFPPYGEVSDPRERRFAVVTLHSEGWSARAIAGYLRGHKSTVRRALKRLAAPRRGPLAAGASGALP